MVADESQLTQNLPPPPPRSSTPILMRPPASPREPPQAQSHPSGSPTTPGAAPQTRLPVSPPPDVFPQTDRQTEEQPAADPPQPVKDEQRDEATIVQLRREQERVREQESRINDLQHQLDQMKTMLLRMQQPRSPPSSSDDEADDGGGYTDDENDNSFNSSRPNSPTPPSRQTGRHAASQHSSSSENINVQLPRHPPIVPPPPPNPASRVPVAPTLRPSFSSVAKQPRKVQSTAQTTPDRFAKADLSRLATALEPSKVQRWVNDLLETIEDYSPDAAWLLALPAPSARLALDRYPHLRPLDRWAARQAINTMQTDKPYVRLLLNSSTSEAISARTSGVELLVYVRDRAAYCSGETARVRVAQFDAKSYLDNQMDAATTHLQADELRNDFLALPAERTAVPNGLLRTLLKKLPTSIALPKIMLEDKLTEAEAMGIPPPWSFDQLVNVVAQHILVAASRTEAVAIGGVQVHAVEAKNKKSSDLGLRPDQMKCPCCGQQGHRPRDCPTTCKICKQRSCPGNYGAACIIVARTFPTNILNASGKPIPPNIKTILQKAHEKKIGQSQSKKSANVLEATAISTDNPHLWDVMTDEEGKTTNMLMAVASQPEASASDANSGVKEACPTFKTADGRTRSTSIFDDALFQFRPDMYDVCSSLAMDDARALLSRSPPVDDYKELECCKATADVVQVQTDVGVQEYRVPATHLARERAPDALEWRRADDAALQVLLNTPSRDGRRNVLVPVSKPASLGQPIIPSVLQRRIKTDPVTRKLIKRKSRLCAAGDRQKIIQQSTGTYQPRQTHADAADDLLIKFVLAASAGTPTRPPMRRVKLDIGNAYSRGIRRRPPAYMSLGKSLARQSDSGEELCLELHTPTYGEEPSGDEWGSTFHVDIESTGWQTAEAVPALYYFNLPDEHGRAFFIRIVDDVLITYPSSCRIVAENTIGRFKEYYHNDVSVEWDPTSFVGYAIIDDPTTGAITLNMASHVEHAVRQHLPGLLESPPVRPSASLKKGQSFQSLADSLRHTPAAQPLDECQTRVQRMVGAMRYPEKVLPVLTLGLHRLSCVAQNPPPTASLVADLLLEVAFDHRFEGLTYGGCSDAEAAGLQLVSAFGVEEADRPPDKLIAYGDATWTAGLQEVATTDAEGREVASRDLYSVVLAFRGAAVLHQTKKLALLVDCLMAAEEVATSKAAEYVEYAAQIARALGVADEEPVTIGTDNVANRQVAMRQGAASRSKHLLRRYWVLMQRVQAGEVRVVHVKDDANPADFLTKWVSAKKLRASVAYVSGQSARRQGFVKNEIMKRRLSGA